MIGDTPMRVLMAIAAGEKMVSGSKIVLAPNGKPRMSKAFAYPTLKERSKAATALLSRVMPSLQAAALQMDATVAGDVKHSVEPHNPLLVAQALALLIHDGVIDPAPIRALIDQPRERAAGQRCGLRARAAGRPNSRGAASADRRPGTEGSFPARQTVDPKRAGSPKFLKPVSKLRPRIFLVPVRQMQMGAPCVPSIRGSYRAFAAAR